MNETTGQDQADPHTQGWFWRLREFFGLNTHPVAHEDSDEGDLADHDAKLQKWIRDQFQISDNRIERYRVFREMDAFDLISAIFDVYAEEMTQPDYDRKKSVWIEAKQQKMIEAGNTCLQNIMLEDRLFAIARQMCLLGDYFSRNLYQPGKGVLGWKFAEPSQTHRLDDKYDRLVGFKQDGHKYRLSKTSPVSYPWDYIHFRLLGKDAASAYGSSMAAPLFRPWRQLTLFEDSDLMYNLRKAANRNLVLVDVGGLDDVESGERLRRFERRMKKNVFIDPASAAYKKNYNPLTPIEDVYLGLRGADDQTRIEPMGGNDTPLSPDRMDHYRNKLFGAAKVPKAYMGFEGEIDAKATLMQQDVRFARSMKRGQKSLIYGIRATLDIHYMLYAADATGATNAYDINENPYLVMMSPIAYLDEMERLELVQLRYSLIEAMAALGQSLQIDATAWTTYILIHYAKLPINVVEILTRKGDGGTPPQPGGGGGFGVAAGGGFGERNADLTRRKRTMLLEVEKQFGQSNNNGKWKQGYYEPTDAEQKVIAEAIHKSPLLRKVIGDIAEMHENDFDMADQQTDVSLLPPRFVRTEDGKSTIVELSDSVGDSDDVIRLRKEVESLGKPDQLQEQEPATQDQ